MLLDTQPGAAPAVAVNFQGVTGGAVLNNRCGAVIPPPSAASWTLSNFGTVTNAYANELGCSAASGLNVPISFVNDTGTPGALFVRGATAGVAPNGDMLNAAIGYYFVNEFAYGPYEPGCNNNQVYGWYVNLSTGELQLFTNTDGVPTNVTRACLSSDLALAINTSQKRYLKVLNKLYKLSKAAVKEVNGIPAQGGNIVEVCDCKGDKWLLYVNTASSQNGSPLSTCNYQFAIVACKLC
jgi:hypothetical protein